MSDQMIGKTLGRYRVLEKIGRGGMGEVFLAEDTSLRRRVALKFLPPEMRQNVEARKRFIREARSAAALDHPYICHINEVAESEGRDFIVMEYVDGQTLRSKIGQGPLPLEETLRIGTEVAEALEAAHGKGIIHRDIKPENIMLTGTGHAKVMDFGLAKQVAPPAEEVEIGGPTMTLLTSEGTTAGTLAYMSPEQLRGHPADARSDIWALGVTLYETASGARPFPGRSGFEVSSAILNRPPLPLPPGVPAELGATILRCLEKEPAKRYQRVKDVRAALDAVRAGTAATWAAWRYRMARRRWLLPAAAAVAVAALIFALDVGGLRARITGGAGAAGRPFKLAVLPFENLTGDPEQEFLSDGLTQDMISELGRLHAARMSVIGFTSVMRYKKSATPLAQIGRDLGVSFVLGGSCRREDTRVRVSAELIEVRDQTQRWSETYERDISGLLALQSEVARKVAGALALKLLPGAEARLAKVRSLDPEAYEAYLKGVKNRETMTKAGFDEAERYFNFAIEKDPGYAAPWAGLAALGVSRVQLNMEPREEGLIKAKSAALKALGLDDGETEAHRVQAGILTWLDWDWPAAERAWNRLFEIDPDNAAGLPGYSHFLLVRGRLDEAITKSKRSMELDPYNIRNQSFHAVVLMHSRRFDEAIAVARKVLSVQPRSEVARSALMDSLFMRGRHDDLLAVEREKWAKDHELSQALEQGYGEAGFSGAEGRLADALAARYGRPGSVSGYTLANCYARAGDKDRVIEWLGKAYEEHNNNLPYMRTPVFDLVRDDPRVQDLARRVGLPPIRPQI
jgi:TolB-like protein/tRNA A-37 threonylcarbamoyl transferase component Bud32